MAHEMTITLTVGGELAPNVADLLAGWEGNADVGLVAGALCNVVWFRRRIELGTRGHITLTLLPRQGKSEWSWRGSGYFHSHEEERSGFADTLAEAIEAAEKAAAEITALKTAACQVTA